MSINYFQPIYLEYNQELVSDITGFMMPFPNLKKFNAHYGKPEENAPTTPLLNTIRLLLPQIRVINPLVVNGEPNPATFLAYEEVDPEILALIFKRWVEVCYPESEHKALKPYCSADQFHWTALTPNHLEFWAPSWAIAWELSKHEYQMGENSFKFLFGPGRSGNTVELVSWPPIQNIHGHRASVALVISTQSDIDPKKINLHFQMKRWIVKQGKDSGIRLEKRTTGCYVRRLRSWLGDYNLLQPNAFTVLEANYRREGTEYVPQWKNRQVSQILERLSVQIPNIIDVLANPFNFIETDQTDILVPARVYQKAGWGTGFTFEDERTLLEQIKDVLPTSVVLSAPWKRISVDRDLKKFINQRFQNTLIIPRPSKGKLPKITREVLVFLAERANNLTIQVRYLTEEVQEALALVAKHYFGNSLNLEFYTSEGLADPIVYKESKRNEKLPQTQHIQHFGEQNQPKHPMPMIVEILPPNHPKYRNDQDPKPFLKSLLPKYNFIPQCILSAEKVDNNGTGEAKTDEDLQENIYNRALSAILDAILPFDLNYPLSTPDDNTVYAGLYVSRRNQRTATQSFNESILLVIYKNEVSMLLPQRDLHFRTMPDTICELAKHKTSKANCDQVISNMLTTLSQTYSAADDIYLFVHGQNARSYWSWLQDSKFDPDKPPTNKIHIVRIRDQMNNEVPQGYGLATKQETFTKGAVSFTKGIFIPQDCDINTTRFTQTVLSIAEKPIKLAKEMSRYQAWISRGYEKEIDKDGKLVSKLDSKTGKCIIKNIAHNSSPRKDWKAPQPRAHNILATRSPDKFKLHHLITHHLRSCHWWTSAECASPLPLSLAEKSKEWCFNDGELENKE
ncbi:MAG: pPIWI_RE module domain-containing protein [Nostoc sp. DedVER02]|uniref:pPIWI_RE module domain-containing protein n=1 Tax=unclassified Nostoc TaxID=2593658 RepID=UPI002AD51C46|nr:MULTISPECIES: DUF3962 domain-containing protein [unclassified Nostoc]MDZ7988292.1 DUF3962 domain-containing protein [Nostoc sp. DedVER02]MDZ8113588.1 DUF3962 domain-containing protein [Nostoc sp. DedVER01b]